MWEITDNLVAFPYGWQRPANTEEWAYDSLLLDDTSRSPFYEIVCFPWATLIDLLRKTQISRAEIYKDALCNAPPKHTLIRATICQHIYAMDMIPFFKKIKITDIFWSHATKDLLVINGIRIHPFPLVPVACLEDADFILTKKLEERKYLYSFIGAYDENLYLSKSRKFIFELPKSEDSIIIKRQNWHFEDDVYSKQIFERNLTAEQKNRIYKYENEYIAVMKNTKFSLCPSGSGPNSIRLWESLGFGCIPILLSDNLRLPGDYKLWESAVISLQEDSRLIKELPALLNFIFSDKDKINSMLIAGRRLWDLYSMKKGIQSTVLELNNRDFILQLLKIK